MTADYEVDLAPVTLYLLVDWPASLGHIVKGSALVGSAADDEAGCVVVDYAGAVFPRSPAATLADHAHNAWGRHVKTRLNPGRGATIARVTVEAGRVYAVAVDRRGPRRRRRAMPDGRPAPPRVPSPRSRAARREAVHTRDALRPHARSMGCEDLLDAPAHHTTPTTTPRSTP